MRTFIATSLLLAGCATGSQAVRFADVATPVREAPAAQKSESAEPAADARRLEPAAAYVFNDDLGPLAHVAIWSEGCYVASDGTGTIVHVAAQIQNQSAKKLVVDSPALELLAFDARGAALPRARVASIEPLGIDSKPIRSQATHDLDVYFALPAAVAPESVSSLQVTWAIAQVGGPRYLQVTNFRRDPARSDASVIGWVPVYSSYNPMLVRPERAMFQHKAPVLRVVVPGHGGNRYR